MRIVISGIPIDVQKKNIKNMHLQVKPPDGHTLWISGSRRILVSNSNQYRMTRPPLESCSLIRRSISASQI